MVKITGKIRLDYKIQTIVSIIGIVGVLGLMLYFKMYFFVILFIGMGIAMLVYVLKNKRDFIKTLEIVDNKMILNIGTKEEREIDLLTDLKKIRFSHAQGTAGAMPYKSYEIIEIDLKDGNDISIDQNTFENFTELKNTIYKYYKIRVENKK